MASLCRLTAPGSAGASSCGRKAASIVAADYFTVETWSLRRLHVLFFMELGRRRILSFGVTSNPDQAWVSQQVRI